MYRKLISILGTKCAPKLIGLVIAMFIGSLLELIGFSLIVAVIAAMSDPTGLATNDYVGMICGWLGLESSTAGIPWLICGVIGVYLVRAAYLIFQYYIVVRFVRMERHRLSSTLFAATLSRPYRYFLDRTSAEIQRDVIRDTGQFAVYLNALLQIAAEALVIAVMVIFLLLVSPLISLLCIVAAVVLIGGSRLLIHRIVFAAGQRVRKASALRTRWLNEAVRGIKLVKISQRESYFSERYREADETFSTAEYKQQLWARVPAIIVETVVIIAALIYLLVTFSMGFSLAETLPQLSAFVLVAARLVPAFNRINNFLSAVSYNRPSVDKLEKHLDELRSVDYSGSNRILPADQSSPAPLTLQQGISLNHVAFSYESAVQPVLRNASLTIERGSCVGIVGHSGIGKTTLIDVLLGLLEPSEGSVTVDGADIHSVYASYLASVAYLPQDAFIIEGTVADNVAFGEAAHEVDEARIWHALEFAALNGFVKAQPTGLDTRVGEGGIRLSGGERQRLALARAIYSRCELLVLDEATSALDAATATSILNALAQLKGDHTIVIVAHQTNALAHCDVVYRVHDGHVTREEGTTAATDDH